MAALHLTRLPSSEQIGCFWFRQGLIRALLSNAAGMYWESEDDPEALRQYLAKVHGTGCTYCVPIQRNDDRPLRSRARLVPAGWVLIQPGIWLKDTPRVIPLCINELDRSVRDIFSGQGSSSGKGGLAEIRVGNEARTTVSVVRLSLEDGQRVVFELGEYADTLVDELQHWLLAGNGMPRYGDYDQVFYADTQ
ncbi:MAG: hypothetical protein KY476_16705 [Planctomycetes bacterium]|nr:hypothetical protein [Planctomycetota bacterium]